MTERLGSSGSQAKPFEDGINEAIGDLLLEKVQEEMQPPIEQLAESMGLPPKAGRVLLKIMFDPGHELSATRRPGENSDF